MFDISKYLGLPRDVSAHGHGIDYTIGLVHILMFLLFVGWGIYFIYALVRFRRSKSAKADYVGVKSHFSSYIEIGVAVFEAILLIGFSIPIWAKLKTDFPSEKDSTVIRIVAEQFAWNIHYPGPDGVFGKTDIKLVNKETNPIGLDKSDPNAKDDITAINQLHFPVGKPVIIHLSSKDVIHSFFIPEMRIKHDAIPGTSVPIWFQATQTGNFEIACAQLCGLGHYRMRGYVTIHTPEEYKAWIDEQVKAMQE
jgi:cytochrome c oxidase subunit 2